MTQMGFMPHTVSLIRSLYENQKSNVCMAGGMSKWFAVLRGVRQGCTLYPHLFNIMCELLMCLALDGFEGGFRIGGRLVANWRYADDIVFIASTREELQELVNRVHNAAGSVGMKLNVRKMKTMSVTDDQTPIRVQVGNETLKKVHSFKYLGARFNVEATCVEEVKTRLGLARDRLGSLITLWRLSLIHIWRCRRRG